MTINAASQRRESLMANIAWPAALNKPVDFHNYHLDSDTSGGVALGGGEQFVVSSGARWGAKGRWFVGSAEQVLAWRSLRSQLKGRANAAVLPNFDGRRLSWPVEAATGRVLKPRVAHELAGTLGLEGTAYAGLEIPAAAEINATVQTTAILGATTVAINKTQGGTILAGQQFGITAERLYEIATIVSVVGSVTTVTIWPPLRAAAPATTAVRFTRPTCLMRCLNMNEQMQVLEGLRFAEINLEFVEYI